LTLGLSLSGALAEAPDDADATFADMGVKVADISQALASQRALGLKTVGTTALVFKLDLEGSIDAAFKPASRRHPQGYLAEIAAFRIGRALGMSNVAPAVPRSFPRVELDRLVSASDRATYDALAPELIAGPDGKVWGAAIYWIPELKEIGIDSRAGIAQWRRWLSQHTVGPTRERSRAIAAQVSSMILLDFVIGNWDRFSGANAQGDPSERHVFVRDHNVAFFEPLPATQMTRLTGRLSQVERFSRELVGQLRSLTLDSLRAVIRAPADPDGFSVLTERQLAGIMDRRATVLSYVAALIDRHGEDNVLTFP
jgi:hypothetical protein